MRDLYTEPTSYPVVEKTISDFNNLCINIYTTCNILCELKSENIVLNNVDIDNKISFKLKLRELSISAEQGVITATFHRYYDDDIFGMACDFAKISFPVDLLCLSKEEILDKCVSPEEKKKYYIRQQIKELQKHVS